MKDYEKKEYTVSIYDLYLDDDGILRVDKVNRNNEVPSFDIGDAWIEGYIQGMNDTGELSHSYWRVPEYTGLFRIKIGATVKVFFLHKVFNFDLKGIMPHALFLEYECTSAYPSHEISLEEILEAIEKHLVDEAARESIDDHEASLLEQEQ